MIATFAILGSLLAADAPADSSHGDNPVYGEIAAKGFTVGSSRLTFPAPILRGTETAEAERAALRGLMGSDDAVADLTRDSVTAPFKLRTRDEPAGDLGVIRGLDLWFVVHAKLDDIDPTGLLAGGREGKAVEAGNMRFRGSRLTDKELAPLGIKPVEGREWFVHVSGRLLDRIEVEATDRITASRSETSWRIASKTDAKFDHDRDHPNRWFPLSRHGGQEQPGASRLYPGGAGDTTISRLVSVPGALLVEVHAAFFEPREWFDDRPILKSKIALVAQDRIRGLRRELAKAKSRGGR